MGFGFFLKGSEEIGLGRGLVFLYLVWVLFMVFFLSRVQVLVPIGVCGGDLFFWFLGFKSDGHRLDRGSLGCLFLYLLGSQRGGVVFERVSLVRQGWFMSFAG